MRPAGGELPGGGEQPQPQPARFPAPGWRPVGVGVCSQAMTSQARATTAHEIRFWLMLCRGRLVRPVVLAMRMRS